MRHSPVRAREERKQRELDDAVAQAREVFMRAVIAAEDHAAAAELRRVNDLLRGQGISYSDMGVASLYEDELELVLMALRYRRATWVTESPEADALDDLIGRLERKEE